MLLGEKDFVSLMFVSPHTIYNISGHSNNACGMKTAVKLPRGPSEERFELLENVYQMVCTANMKQQELCVADGSLDANTLVSSTTRKNSKSAYPSLR